MSTVVVVVVVVVVNVTVQQLQVAPEVGDGHGTQCNVLVRMCKQALQKKKTDLKLEDN